MLFNPRIQSAPRNIGDFSWRNVVFKCQSLSALARAMASANVLDLLDCEYSWWRSVTSSAFRDLVVHVVFHCSEEKMVGVYTRRIVALVQNGKANGNSPVVQFPRNTVAGNHSPPIPDLSISLAARSGEPHPARTQFGANGRPVLVDFIPESNFQRGSGIFSDGHGVTSSTGCKVSRLGRGLTTMLGPFSLVIIA